MEMPNRETYKMKVLIDTGAETNLVRKGLVPEHLFHMAEKPIRLVTASGQVLPGGDKVVRLGMTFGTISGENAQTGTFECCADFLEAEIKVDAILSYPWMVKMKIGVFPHKGALILDRPGIPLLVSTTNVCQFQKKK